MKHSHGCGRLKMDRCLRLQPVMAGFVLAVFLAMGLTSLDAMAQPDVSPEEIQAAYIQKFVGYIEWPPRVFADATAPILVGITGSDMMFDLVSGVAAGRTVQGRPVEVRRLLKPEPGASVQRVHLLFVGQNAWRDLEMWATWGKENSAVVTTDAPEGVERGASLAFVHYGKRVRFEASLTAANQSGVKLSARLLAVAERVVGAPP